MDAHKFLEEAARQMKERAALRDSPNGERVVETIVEMFNSLTGHELSEADGWKFLLLLKLVRSENGKYHADDYVDLAAYSVLLGECESKEVEMREAIAEDMYGKNENTNTVGPTSRVS